MNFLRKISLAQWIMISLVLGILIGLPLQWAKEADPAFASTPFFKNFVEICQLLSKLFISMIQSVIAPLIFATLVIGIASHPKVGRLAFRSILYFEIVTTLALFIGLAAVNIAQPGKGVPPPPKENIKEQLKTYEASSEKGKEITFMGIIAHIVPKSVIDAAAKNDVLQIVFWSTIFAIALGQVKAEHKKIMLDFLEALAVVMFKFVGIIMKFAPIGVGAAIAATVAGSGKDALFALMKLILTLYLALLVLIVFVLIPIAWMARLPMKKFGKAVYEPALIAFSSASSEAALPKAMQAMQDIGVPKKIVSFVMPLGYSFNLDGTTLYLAVASVFCAQVAGIDLSWQQQIIMMLTLMVTSKGVAAVPRASLVILSSTLVAFNLPLETIFLIMGVDALMDMARTTVNLLGNCLASCVMARWEGEFDDKAGTVTSDS